MMGDFVIVKSLFKIPSIGYEWQIIFDTSLDFFTVVAYYPDTAVSGQNPPLTLRSGLSSSEIKFAHSRTIIEI